MDGPGDFNNKNIPRLSDDEGEWVDEEMEENAPVPTAKPRRKVRTVLRSRLRAPRASSETQSKKESLSPRDIRDLVANMPNTVVLRRWWKDHAPGFTQADLADALAGAGKDVREFERLASKINFSVSEKVERIGPGRKVLLPKNGRARFDPMGRRKRKAATVDEEEREGEEEKQKKGVSARRAEAKAERANLDALSEALAAFGLSGTDIVSPNEPAPSTSKINVEEIPRTAVSPAPSAPTISASPVLQEPRSIPFPAPLSKPTPPPTQYKSPVFKPSVFLTEPSSLFPLAKYPVPAQEPVSVFFVQAPEPAPSLLSRLGPISSPTPNPTPSLFAPDARGPFAARLGLGIRPSSIFHPSPLSQSTAHAVFADPTPPPAPTSTTSDSFTRYARPNPWAAPTSTPPPVLSESLPNASAEQQRLLEEQFTTNPQQHQYTEQQQRLLEEQFTTEPQPHGYTEAAVEPTPAVPEVDLRTESLLARRERRQGYLQEAARYQQQQQRLLEQQFTTESQPHGYTEAVIEPTPAAPQERLLANQREWRERESEQQQQQRLLEQQFTTAPQPHGYTGAVVEPTPAAPGVDPQTERLLANQREWRAREWRARESEQQQRGLEQQFTVEPQPHQYTEPQQQQQQQCVPEQYTHPQQSAPQLQQQQHYVPEQYIQPQHAPQAQQQQHVPDPQQQQQFVTELQHQFAQQQPQQYVLQPQQQYPSEQQYTSEQYISAPTTFAAPAFHPVTSLPPGWESQLLQTLSPELLRSLTPEHLAQCTSPEAFAQLIALARNAGWADDMQALSQHFSTASPFYAPPHFFAPPPFSSPSPYFTSPPPAYTPAPPSLLFGPAGCPSPRAAVEVVDVAMDIDEEAVPQDEWWAEFKRVTASERRRRARVWEEEEQEQECLQAREERERERELEEREWELERQQRERKARYERDAMADVGRALNVGWYAYACPRGRRAAFSYEYDSSSDGSDSGSDTDNGYSSSSSSSESSESSSRRRTPAVSPRARAAPYPSPRASPYPSQSPRASPHSQPRTPPRSTTRSCRGLVDSVAWLFGRA
ncbi:hypothetical protein C8R44DRAFT_870771 [Mycena epipterygia]|nr:hypothetical protein C8R44DRAFT_870771 [Mycena epipterygia]